MAVRHSLDAIRRQAHQALRAQAHERVMRSLVHPGQHLRPADMLHGLGGHDAEAASMWEARHPAAMGGHGPMPGWVLDQIRNGAGVQTGYHPGPQPAPGGQPIPFQSSSGVPADVANGFRGPDQGGLVKDIFPARVPPAPGGRFGAPAPVVDPGRFTRGMPPVAGDRGGAFVPPVDPGRADSRDQFADSGRAGSFVPPVDPSRAIPDSRDPFTGASRPDGGSSRTLLNSRPDQFPVRPPVDDGRAPVAGGDRSFLLPLGQGLFLHPITGEIHGLGPGATPAPPAPVFRGA